MASPNLSEIVTTTLRNRSRQLADNVSENNAILKRLSEKGNVKLKAGGRNIVQELDYNENDTFKWYQGFETLDISPSDVLSAAEFDWKQAAVAVTISGLEQLQNSGKDAIIDLLEARITNAERTMSNKIAESMYSDGTGDGGKEVGGLQLLVADAPTTGTVGGINRATYAFWRNYVVDPGAAATSVNIQGYMNDVFLNTSRGTDKPDLILSDNNYYDAYWSSLQAIQRIQDPNVGQSGFLTLKFQNADVVFDGGIGGNAPANRMYFLNTNYIHFCVHRDRNFVPLDPDRYSTNQDALVKLIAFAGNMTLSYAKAQGVLTDN
jgi:hypothetical protein